VNGYLQLRYDVGSDRADPSGSEQHVSLPNVNVTDGALHVVSISRVGKRVSLKLDSGEGRYSSMNEGNYP